MMPGLQCPEVLGGSPQITIGRFRHDRRMIQHRMSLQAKKANRICQL